MLVTHRPDLGVLARAMAALTPQVGAVVLVDDATPGSVVRDFAATQPGMQPLLLPQNIGLAHALNAGVQRARALPEIRQVLLLDQDSIPEAGMVAALRSAVDRLAAHGPVAAVGPSFHDPREQASAPFVRIRFPFNRKLHCAGDCSEIRCDFLISSGCLIPLAVLDVVGGMDEDLFIDNVDLDWCFRATAAGYGLYGICAARMQHHLGDRRRRVPGVARGIVVHAPERLYYMMRNRVLLYRRAHTPRRWIAQDIPRLLVKLLLFSLLVPPRWTNLQRMLAGLRAGLAGRCAPPPSA